MQAKINILIIYKKILKTHKKSLQISLTSKQEHQQLIKHIK